MAYASLCHKYLLCLHCSQDFCHRDLPTAWKTLHLTWLWATFPCHAPDSHQHVSAVFQERMFCKLIRLAYQININASRSLSLSVCLSLVLFLLWQWPGNILNKWVISDIKCLVNCAEYSVHIHTTHKNINSHSIYMYSSGQNAINVKAVVVLNYEWTHDFHR